MVKCTLGNGKEIEVTPKKLNSYSYLIEKQEGMNVPVKIFADEKLFKKMCEDNCICQGVHVSTLPGIKGESIMLSDAHQGYGFSIGGVAAFDAENGIISPSGIGFDINCGVRVVVTNLTQEQMKPKILELLDTLFKHIPPGVGRKSQFKLTDTDLNEVLQYGAKWAVEKGYGTKEDLEFCEEEGSMLGADYTKVSKEARARGIGQLGTLGSGNHFIEIQYVAKIQNTEVAHTFGIEKEGQVVVMVHCGSRGFGHQIASDYIKKMEQEYGTENLPDRELACAPIKSQLGRDYYSAMCCAVNFAFANKQLITHWVREEMKHLFPDSEVGVVYDVCHNIAKFEKYFVDGKIKEICVHRKGATRSFGPGREEIPRAYRKVGQPVLIPGTMGTASYVLVGAKKSEEISWGSSVHGAGRVMSRSKAIRELKGEDTKEKLRKKNIEIKSRSFKAIAEESPEVYKDIEEVVNVVHDLGISKKVARLKPLVVIIG